MTPPPGSEDPFSGDHGEIEILPEDVPLGELPEDLDPDTDIGDSDVPLAELPQTGQLWWPVLVMAAAGILCLVIGICSKARRKA